MALAASLDNSEDHRPTVKTRSLLIANKSALTRENHVRNVHLRDPVSVDLSERCTSVNTLRGLQRTDQNPIRSEEITDGCALSQELWIGQNIKSGARLGVGLQDRPHGFGCTTRHGRLLDDDLGRSGDGRDSAGCELDVTVTERNDVRSVSVHVITHSLSQDTEFAEGKMYGENDGK